MTTVAVVLLAVALALGAGAGAYALTRGSDDPEGRRVVAATSTPAESRPARIAASAGVSPTVAAPATDVPPPTADTTPGTRPDRSTTTATRVEQPPANSSTGPIDPPDRASGTGPVEAMRDHWHEISDGRYAAAYALFAEPYRNRVTESSWTAGIKDYAPRVRLLRTEYVRSVGAGRATVLMDLVTRDRGASSCIRFAGRVLVQREDGAWRYWGNGPGHTFRSKGIMSRTDDRCAPLFL